MKKNIRENKYDVKTGWISEVTVRNCIEYFVIIIYLNWVAKDEPIATMHTRKLLIRGNYLRIKNIVK